MPIYTATEKGLYYKFATKGIPRTYVVDGEGVVRAVLTDSPLAGRKEIGDILDRLLGSTAGTRGEAELGLTMKVPVGDDYFFEFEHTISQLTLFLFDTETKKLAKKISFENIAQYKIKGDSQYDLRYELPSQRVHVGTYNIFAVANYDLMPEDIEDQDELLNLVDGITYATGVISSIPESGPVMTNQATSLLGIDLTQWEDKTYNLTIEMERVLAKLQIGIAHNYFELKHNGRKYADVNVTNYKLVNLNKSYYLFQHKDNITTLGAKPDFVLPDNFEEETGTGDEYIVDPLFYEKTAQATAIAKFANYYTSWYGSFATEDFAAMPSANNFGYAYLLENTAFKECQKNGYSTGMVFKAAISPVFVYLYDYKTKTLQAEYRPEYWSEAIYLYRYNFYGSLEAINAASGLTLDVLETYDDDQLYQYGIKQCKFNMGVYETYYTYWIRHRTNTDNEMSPMRYGVVRNNYYRLTITGVSGIGNSRIVPQIMRDNYPNSFADIEVDVTTFPARGKSSIVRRPR